MSTEANTQQGGKTRECEHTSAPSSHQMHKNSNIETDENINTDTRRYGLYLT